MRQNKYKLHFLIRAFRQLSPRRLIFHHEHVREADYTATVTPEKRERPESRSSGIPIDAPDQRPLEYRVRISPKIGEKNNSAEYATQWAKDAENGKGRIVYELWKKLYIKTRITAEEADNAWMQVAGKAFDDKEAARYGKENWKELKGVEYSGQPFSPEDKIRALLTRPRTDREEMEKKLATFRPGNMLVIGDDQNLSIMADSGEARMKIVSTKPKMTIAEARSLFEDLRRAPPKGMEKTYRDTFHALGENCRMILQLGLADLEAGKTPQQVLEELKKFWSLFQNIGSYEIYACTYMNTYDEGSSLQKDLDELNRLIIETWQKGLVDGPKFLLRQDNVGGNEPLRTPESILNELERQDPFSPKNPRNQNFDENGYLIERRGSALQYDRANWHPTDKEEKEGIRNNVSMEGFKEIDSPIEPKDAPKEKTKRLILSNVVGFGNIEPIYINMNIAGDYNEEKPTEIVCIPIDDSNKAQESLVMASIRAKRAELGQTKNLAVAFIYPKMGSWAKWNNLPDAGGGAFGLDKKWMCLQQAMLATKYLCKSPDVTQSYLGVGSWAENFYGLNKQSFDKKQEKAKSYHRVKGQKIMSKFEDKGQGGLRKTTGLQIPADGGIAPARDAALEFNHADATPLGNEQRLGALNDKPGLNFAPLR